MTREELIHSAIAELQYQNEIDELYHHGIIGQKWGVRRYQNEDGSLTSAGKTHYRADDPDEEKRRRKTAAVVAGTLGVTTAAKAVAGAKIAEKITNWARANRGLEATKVDNGLIARSAAIRAGKAAVVSGLLTYGGMRLHDVRKERLRNVVKEDPTDSSITKRTKQDFNNMDDASFRGKYGVTKDVYAKRVYKYGDPQRNAPLAKAGRALSKMKHK